MVDSNFYVAFENLHRGSRELIKSRLEVYLPFILPIKQFHKSGKGLDLGCGRGEWLELMQEHEIDIQGVDLDEGMIKIANERGLNAICSDALTTLKSISSDSLILISGFHIAEHLEFSTLSSLVREAFRALKPGGLLILETPNAENIIVGSESFYLDPTHIRPIPSELLRFLVEYTGFEKSKMLRLQEAVGLNVSKKITLSNVLYGVSPDYAIVGLKGGSEEITSETAKFFNIDYGLSRETLVNRYDQQLESKSQDLELKSQDLESKSQDLESKSQDLESKSQDLESRSQDLESKSKDLELKSKDLESRSSNLESRSKDLESKLKDLESKLKDLESRSHQQELFTKALESRLLQNEVAIHSLESSFLHMFNSLSWRITAPGRMVGNMTRFVIHVIKTVISKLKLKIKLLLVNLILYAKRRTHLIKVISIFLLLCPPLKRRIKIKMNKIFPKNLCVPYHANSENKLDNLTLRTRAIHENLKAAIKKNN